MVSTRDVAERLRNCGLTLHWRGEPPASFGGLATDSRIVQPGDLFCAIRGVVADGHEHAREAAKLGATALLVEHLVSDVRIPQLVVSDSRLAAAHLASLFHGDPGARLRLLGVTGTDGKTTTVWIARHLLSQLGPTASLGTLGTIQVDGLQSRGTLTTPDPAELMRTLCAVADAGAEFVAMEVSSHALDQHRVDALRFRLAVLTNLTREHLDYHPDMERYREAKLRILELMAPGGTCLVNVDDAAWSGVHFGRTGVVTYGMGGTAEVRAFDVRYDIHGSSWRMATLQGRRDVRLPLVGDFNVYNALGAAAAALELGLSLDRVVECLATTPQVPGRLEILRREPTLVVRDYAHTPSALRRVLHTLRALTSGNLFVVFGCGGDRDRGKRPLMGQAAIETADRAIITTDNPRSEDPATIAREVVKDLPSDRYEIVLDRTEAIHRAIELASPGDLVLLAGKGHERAQIIGARAVPFDEAEVVRSALAETVV